MTLIPNWRAVAARSHSMWSLYLSIICLIAPELIYLVAGIDTAPRVWWLMGLALLIYGTIGRLLDQSIDHNKLQSPWAVGLVAAIAVLLVATGDRRSIPAVPVAGAPTVSIDRSVLPVSEKDFVAVAVPFIGRWEGLRLEAYRDIVGVWTVCYGETKGVRAGDRHTKDECDAMLAREVVAYRRGLHKSLAPETRTERLPPLRDVAFVSLAYNVGVAAASRSTAVKRLNSGDVPGACEALTWWNKAGGRVIRGLVNRRSEEKQHCLDGWA